MKKREKEGALLISLRTVDKVWNLLPALFQQIYIFIFLFCCIFHVPRSVTIFKGLLLLLFPLF